ncbi:MAG: ABC transporter ATP-binding protein [Chloroflexota bacterium]
MPFADSQSPTVSPLLTMRGITKRFQQVLANDRVDFDIFPGQIHALLGENGAGKSTLMKILYGFYRADGGEIRLRGEAVQIRSPQDAHHLQMGMVFQNLNLIPAMTVAENIALFLQDLPAVYHPKNIHARIINFSRQYGLEVNPQARVSQLAIGEQQKVEILKLLLSNARLLIFDEPTRVLAPHEIEALYQILDKLRSDGYSLVLITHKMKDVLQCADRITVLRGGRVAGVLPGSDATEDRLVSLMFDKPLAAGLHLQAPAPGPFFDPKGSSKESKLSPVLQLEGAATRSEGGAPSLKDIRLEVFPGEIVGIAGVSGNGQKELGDVVLGMERLVKGQKRLFGKDYSRQSIGRLRRDGVSFIPENPLSMATAPFMTVLENMALTQPWRYARWGGLRVDWQAVRRDMEAALAAFGFSFSPYSLARSLSGGNLQRLIIAREMSFNPRLIIASYLTSGLDVQSASIARQALLQARGAGAGVLLISEDLDELFSLSDRLVVLYDGRIVGEYKPSETDVYTIGHLMTGHKATPPAPASSLAMEAQG